MASIQDMGPYLLSEAAALALAVARVSGFVMVSPFPGRNVPAQSKIGLILLFAFLARAANPLTAVNLTLDFSLLAIAPTELGIGLVIGFVVRLTFASAEILAASFAQATGLTMGAIFDPSLGTEDPIPARIVSMFGMLLFVALGAHRVAIAYTLESFRALPIGTAVSISAAAPSIVDFLAQVTEAGVRIALPVMAVALVVHVALALIARASPSLQILSVGMGITVAAGFLVIMASLEDAGAGLSVEFQREGARIDQILLDTAPAAKTP